ncbi:orotidine-5'-phosphate decarboxylase [Brevibacillus humidisoli]|uniref:orotidine-5'-phosphate decarboxylase n=1 Tax=Brevibacillus humidisoli TaxID=2895522 RepID=UPI001E56666B|nr:orotidine-5'-phosphate decarboxylase [Brevibacillus humidisoli]UFJ41968.1 orotidine-5'-phosphate decarboxylase [Brevibacillus humidisoli]
MENVKSRIILALDFPAEDEMNRCLSALQGELEYVKVGMELFYAAGPSIVYALKERGLKVFVDLKVHDIPNTARGAMNSLARLGADMVNVHVAGGRAMMEAAREGLEAGAPAGSTRPLLIGVTMLTSTSRQTMNEQLLIPGQVEEVVVGYAQLAKEAGMDGVVASPLEVPLVKQAAGTAFQTVTPGIRPSGSARGDQTRVTTPEEAFRLGSDYIVVGRAVTAAEEPRAAWQAMLTALQNSTTEQGTPTGGKR